MEAQHSARTAHAEILAASMIEYSASISTAMTLRHPAFLMIKKPAATVVYGLLGIASLLLSSIGYLYGHKLLSPEYLVGTLSAVWQILVAFMLLALAGGIGERLLRFSDLDGSVRFSLDVALGTVILSIIVLALGAGIGTGLAALGIPVLILLLLVFKDIARWLNKLLELRTVINGKYEKVIALGTLFILGSGLAYALAPPTAFDALVYHLSIPRAYLQLGHIMYLADTMFWGMPQLTEMLYLPAMRLAGVESATVFAWMIGTVTVVGLLGYVRSALNAVAAWTAVAALLVSENLTRSMSTGYVDWMSMLFGWSAVVTIDYWFKKQEKRMLLLSGVFCGGALGIKYSAGVILVGCIIALVLMQRRQPWKATVSAIFLLGLAAVVVSSPWWFKNFIATGNPFYPFFIPSGSMDRIRLDFYQKVPVWNDWKAVVLLPWQATFFGIDGKVGYSASIGPLLVGLSPLVWINWKLRTETQKETILIAGIITISGLTVWAIGSRLSGLLIQTRLYFVFFPAWAVLAGAGMDAIWNLKSSHIRFGRLIGVLTVLMFGLSILSAGTSFVAQNPALYILRLEGEDNYLAGNLGSYAVAMEAIGALPNHSRVLMLWETRGYYCQPGCDSDEIIDRWHHDATLYATTKAIVQAWHDLGYTQLLVFNVGKDFVRKYDIPLEQTMHWALLDSTLTSLPVQEQIDEGAYTLYRIP
jgi:hypothetical protein